MDIVLMRKFLLLLSFLVILILPQVKASQAINTSVDNEVKSHTCADIRCLKQYRKLKSYAKNGSHVAQVIIAVGYLTGDGLPLNPNKGVQNLLKASSGGSGRAAWMLSSLYREGTYVEQNFELAEQYLDLAVERKFKDALFEVAASQIDLTNTIDNTLAIKMLFFAEERHSLSAKYLIAKFYEFGTVLDVNLLAAAERYSFLAQKNYRDSDLRLQETLQVAKSSHEQSVYQRIKQLDDDIEVISVTGNKFTLTNKLAYIVNSLENSNLYYKSAVSRIPGKSCANSSSNCRVMDDAQKWLRGF
jgi:hypothetical protein